MSKVIVVDDIMGSGKTKWAIQMMKESSTKQRFIFVTPFLKEVKRVKDDTGIDFKVPCDKKGKGTKSNHIKELIRSGNNIITTHSLFMKLDEETINLIKEFNYVLVQDEVVDVMETKVLTSDDKKMLLTSDLIRIDGDKIEWINPEYRGCAETHKEYLASNSTYALDDNLVMWTQPINLFENFSEIYILTYLFEGQYQKYYLDLNEIPYEKKSVMQIGSGILSRYELIDFRKPDMTSIKSKISIYDGKHNEIGKSTSMSGVDGLTFTRLSYLKNDSEKAAMIRKAMINVTRTTWNVKNNNIIWTTNEVAKNQLKGPGYTKGYVAFNLRATNDYREINHCMYILNKFPNVNNVRFLEKNGLTVDKDMYSLSELVQWVFRSAIRAGNPIKVYIPSQRMRNLFYRWLEGEF